MTSTDTTRMAQPKKLVFVELNEVNFDVVRQYLTSHPLPNFRRLLATFRSVETFAESNYEELEPWVQWVSAHSGKTFSEHSIFRLGDGAGASFPQVFELLEQGGLSVGAISPMNSRNALKRSAYFVPDPWTQTPSDPSGFSRRLTKMLQQTVNENAKGRISLSSLLTLAEAAARTLSLGKHGHLLRLVARAKGKQWVKALVLDQFIHLVHLYLLRQKQPDVSFVFFNAGAHIQHHYLFNSPHSGVQSRNPAWYVAKEVDPVLDMIETYDTMLGDYLDMQDKGVQVVVATGLSQVAYDRVKFYYRLKDHADFLGRLNIKFADVLPRMTRDFEVIFADESAATNAASVLATARMSRDGVALFGDIEHRGNSLFVSLTYPTEILAGDSAVFSAGTLHDLYAQVCFVAIKNGMHSTKGFAFVSPGSSAQLPVKPVHVASLFNLTLDLMEVQHPAAA